MNIASRRTVGDVCDFIRGITFKPSDVVDESHPDSVACLRTKNVQQVLDVRDLLYVLRALVSDKKQYVRDGDILISTANSKEQVGKCCSVGALSVEAVIGGFIAVIRPRSSVILPRFLYYWATSPQTQASFRQLSRQTTNIANLPLTDVARLDLPLPPLPEQERIVRLLDEADELRRLRAQADRRTADLVPAIFHEMFGNPGDHPARQLSDVAEVVSGVAKGRRFNGQTPMLVPYLRVANVQAGHLDLSEIKQIEALPSEVEALALKQGDVLLTEGGDFDKLGRGAMLEHDLGNCIHQNHVFRVRVNSAKLTPVFFSQFLQTPSAKDYFLRCAKKTTNLASINMTQLRNLPTPLPPLALQQEFAGRVAQVRGMEAGQGASRGRVEALFQAMLHRAFRGEL